MNELRIQMQERQPRWVGGHATVEYRVARENGWNCGCWHPSVPEAIACVEDRQAEAVA